MEARGAERHKSDTHAFQDVRRYRGVDDLDLGILRRISRGGGMWWGCLDPRLSAQDIAEALQVDRKTVWARLKHWRRTGFHVRQEIVPNPRLFGAGIGGGGVRVGDVREKPRVLRDLARIDGALGGYDQLGEWLVVVYAHESAAALRRSLKEVRAIAGVAEVTACVPFRPPDASVEPTPLDWRVIRALAEDGGADLARAASRVGVSSRTLTRRFERLASGRALWSLPIFDFRQYTGAVLARYLLITEEGADGRDVAKAVRRRMPGLIWCEAMESYFPEEPSEYSWVEFTAHLASAATADDVLREAAALPRVASAEVFFPSRCFLNRSWFDERVAARVTDSALDRSPPRPSGPRGARAPAARAR